SATASAHIKSAPLTAALTAADKVYDGTMAEPDASMSCTVAIVISPDVVNCAATNGAFNGKDVASANQVTSTVTISGGSVSHYTLGAAGSSVDSTTATAAAHISPQAVTASITADDKTYYGTTAATIDCTLA